jgi:lactonase family protein with 7-bladed beta-propeller
MRHTCLSLVSTLALAILAFILTSCSGAPSSTNQSTSGSGQPTAAKTTPVITWATPAAITSSTPLSATQLDATANVAGTFVYTPPAGTVLTAGTQTLSVTFTPTNTAQYSNASATVAITVNSVQPAFLITAEVTFVGTSDAYYNFGVYKFDTGAGTVTTASTLSTGWAAPWAMALSPNHDWIYTADSQCCPEVSTPFAEVFSLNSASGVLSPIAGSPFAAGTGAHNLAIHPSGKYVYYSSGTLPGMIGFSLGSDGAPTLLAGSPFYPDPVGDGGMAITPNGKFLFAVSAPALNNTQIYAFSIDTSTGALSLMGSTTASPAMNSMQIAPAGDYLYVGTTSTISVFALNQQTGQLITVSGSPFQAAKQLTSFALSPDGRFLYAAGCVLSSAYSAPAACEVQAYSVNSITGQISSSGAQQNLGPSYIGAIVTAEGSFVSVATTPVSGLASGGDGTDYAGSISTFSADPTTGALTLKGTTTTAGGPTYLLAVPTQ